MFQELRTVFVYLRMTPNMLMLYLIVLFAQACIFVQSHVRAHAELMWLLSSATPIGWLNRMIQFKEKSRKAVRLCRVQLYLYIVVIKRFSVVVLAKDDKKSSVVWLVLSFVNHITAASVE